MSESAPIVKSFRFELTLTESNEKSCPIFNYKDLVEKKNAEDLKQSLKSGATVKNGLPFGDEDVDMGEVERLAAKFEEKYGGPGPTPRKKKKKYKGDWADVGAGYDENDSFIDNTDAYDEIVPEDISPEHGGFYINSGSLEFKQQQATDLEDVKGCANKNRKRIIEDDDLDSEPERLMAPPAEKKPRIDNMNGHTKKKPIPSKKPPTVKDLIKLPEQQSAPQVGPHKIIKTIESVISSNQTTNPTTTNATGVADESSYESINSTNSVASLYSSTNSTTDDDELLNSLPEDVVVIIEHFKSVIGNNNSNGNESGKVKFSDGANAALIKLYQFDLKSKVKLQIYEHLANLCKCTKDTLYKRAKRAVIEFEQGLLEQTVHSLKEVIDRVMPSIIENYTQECQRINEKKLVHDRESPNGEKPKIARLPKRKFHWSDSSRKILSEIVVRKRELYRIERNNNKESFYQYLEAYFTQKLITVWPEGWISISNLLRESLPYLTKEERPPKTDKKTESTSSVVKHTKSSETTKKTVELPANSLKPPLPPPASQHIKPISLTKSITIESVPSSKLSIRGDLMPNDKDSEIVEIIDDDPPPQPKAQSTAPSQHHQSSKHKHKYSSKKKDEATDVLKVISDIKQLNELSLGGIGVGSNGIGNGSSEPVSVIALNRNHNSLSNKNNVTITPSTSITKISGGSGNSPS